MGLVIFKRLQGCKLSLLKTMSQTEVRPLNCTLTPIDVIVAHLNVFPITHCIYTVTFFIYVP